MNQWRLRRRQLGLTVVEMAARCEVSKRTIYRFERGETIRSHDSTATRLSVGYLVPLREIPGHPDEPRQRTDGRAQSMDRSEELVEQALKLVGPKDGSAIGYGNIEAAKVLVLAAIVDELRQLRRRAY